MNASAIVQKFVPSVNVSDKANKALVSGLCQMTSMFFHMVSPLIGLVFGMHLAKEYHLLSGVAVPILPMAYLMFDVNVTLARRAKTREEYIDAMVGRNLSLLGMYGAGAVSTYAIVRWLLMAFPA